MPDAAGGALAMRKTGVGAAHAFKGSGGSAASDGLRAAPRLARRDGWKFISGPLQEAVWQSMAGRISGWSVEPGEPTGAGLGGAVEVAADEFRARV